jgi:phosphate acyltransferase
MSKLRVIAIDAMGGDVGPDVTVPGAALALEQAPDLSFKFFGKADRITPLVAKHSALAGRAEVIHTDLAIAMDDKPSHAMRRGKGTSMWMALEAVKHGEAQVAISAGNTGALMAMAKLILRPMADIERPALAAFWPTVKGACIVLDVGANVGGTARQLADFALMGAAMSRAIDRIERPRVGLLNVGSEDIKGVEDVKQAHQWLKSIDLPIEYVGFVEGDKIGHAIADVVVVEGFAGNIALKTAEGTAKQIGVYLKEAMTLSIFTKIGAVLASGGFKVLKQRMDPRRVNGATFLGLNGIAIKSHGGTDALGFASAIGVGYKIAISGLQSHLAADLAAFHGKIEQVAEAGKEVAAKDA